MKTLQRLKTACTTALMGLSAIGLGGLGGCSAPSASKSPASAPAGPATAARPAPTSPQMAPTTPSTGSLARNAKDYRKDAAAHLYSQNSQKIYKGRLPPMLEAVGVLNVDIDRDGGVKSVHWTRAPRHVPQVMKEIERMVKAAAPYPAPKHMSQVTYTDVWLWHKSGKFQLDTLTEGQD